MHTTFQRWLIAACLLALFYLPSFAQKHPGPEGRGGRGKPEFSQEQDFRLVSTLMRFGGKTVKDAPFTATVETTYVQTLGDGTKISRQSTAIIARDTEGRTRREQTLSHLGPLAGNATNSEAPKLIFIHDPVLDVEYVVNVQRRTVEKKSFKHSPPSSRPDLPKPANAKQEVLGKQVIEGIEAEGTRTIVTIPAGQIGNDRAVEMITEQWYAPALQEIILSKHRDPRFGENTYRLTNISRREPDATLFRPPADFAVTGTSFDREGRRGRGRYDHDER